jgi:hypothetical protein
MRNFKLDLKRIVYEVAEGNNLLRDMELRRALTNHDNEHYGTMKGVEFIDNLSNYRILKVDSLMESE